jgi:hypothetical protein
MKPLIGSICTALIVLGMMSCARPDSADAPVAGRPALRALTQDELDRYLTFVQAMRAEPGSAEAHVTRDPARLTAFLTGVAAQGRAADLIRSSGFDQRQLAEVHFNMAMAYGALLLDENRVEIEAERLRQQHTIESMKGKATEEELAGMKQAMEASGSRVADAYAAVPAANKMLLRRNIARMQATFRP